VDERAARGRRVGEHKSRRLRGQIFGGDGALRANSHILSKKRPAFITTFAKLAIIHQLASPDLSK